MLDIADSTTGIFFYSKIFSKFSNMNENADVIIENPTFTNVYETYYKIEENGEIKNMTINICGRYFAEDSWNNDYVNIL